MNEPALKRVGRKHQAQQLMVAVLFFSTGLNAAESSLDIGVGFGSDDNIFYTNNDEKRESFGLLDIDFEYSNDLSDTIELDIDAVYEDKYFNDESDARDRFFSGFTQLAYKSGRYEFGIQLDPQYRQFVTSETDGILIVGEKQRIETLKARAFSVVDISDNSSLEMGYESKTKDYKDSNSDYDADTVDFRFRSRISETMRFTLGAEYEQRDYDDRLAVTATGAEVSGEKLEIDRTVFFVRGTWRPSGNQKYSLEYKYRDSDDDFEDFYSHDKDQLTLRTAYEWTNGVVLETKLKFSDKSYDEQLDDNGNSLDRDKSSVDAEVTVPFNVWLETGYEDWYSKLAYEWDDNDSGAESRSYEKSTWWVSIHRVFD